MYHIVFFAYLQSVAFKNELCSDSPVGSAPPHLGLEMREDDPRSVAQPHSGSDEMEE